MSTQMQLRGGTTAETLLFTGAQREVTVDTDKNTLVVQDGITAGGFPLASENDVSDGTFYFNDDTAGGSAADAYILAPKVNTNVPTTYLDGIQLGFTTTNANTGPSTANFQALGVKNLKYADGSDPLAGEISGRVYLIYDAANDWLEIQRKATGPSPQIRYVSGSVAANALTVTLHAPEVLDFRSTVLSSGVVARRSITSDLTLVVPAGATLGTTSAVASKVVLLAIDNAGAVELAVVNFSGGLNLDETTLINTTAISAGASSASTVYSASARAGVPFRVVGFVDSTQATAGTWATTPSLVQGQGGQTLILSDPFTAQYQSAEQAITIGGPLTLSHSLGATPKIIPLRLVCKVAEANWSIGDEVYIPAGIDITGTTAHGVGASADATSIYIRYAANTVVVHNKTTGAGVNITPANWRLVVRAYA
jgi:hypothetical protein